MQIQVQDPIVKAFIAAMEELHDCVLGSISDRDGEPLATNEDRVEIVREYSLVFYKTVITEITLEQARSLRLIPTVVYSPETDRTELVYPKTRQHTVEIKTGWLTVSQMEQWLSDHAANPVDDEDD